MLATARVAAALAGRLGGVGVELEDEEDDEEDDVDELLLSSLLDGGFLLLPVGGALARGAGRF